MPLRVNGQHLEDRQIELEMERLRPEYERAFTDMDPTAREGQLRDWAAENLIERTLIAQEAARSDVTVAPDEVEEAFSRLKKVYDDPKKMFDDLQCQDDLQAHQHIHESLKATKLVERIGQTAAGPTRHQIEQYYAENQGLFVQSEQVRTAHIVKYINWQCDEHAAERVILQAQAELIRGVPFELVVERYSDCPERGGSLGCISRGELVEEFEDMLFHLGPGQVSDVFRTRYGFHIAKVYERIPPKPLPLAQVRAGIEAELAQNLRSEAVYAFVDALRAKAQIERS